jgi:hypothetical protein
MSKNQLWSLLGLVVVVFVVGLLGQHSQAQPELSRAADTALLIKIGDLRFNPSQVATVEIENEPPTGKTLRVFVIGGRALTYVFGTNGEAEALLEFFAARSAEIKPKPPKKQ